MEAQAAKDLEELAFDDPTAGGAGAGDHEEAQNRGVSPEARSDATDEEEPAASGDDDVVSLEDGAEESPVAEEGPVAAAGGALGGAALAAPAAGGAGKDGATKPKSRKRAAPPADKTARPSIPTEKPPSPYHSLCVSS